MTVVLTGSSLVLRAFGFVLLTGCGGRASASGPDTNSGGSLSNAGGKAAAPGFSGASTGPSKGGGSPGAGGAPGSAGASTSRAGESGGGFTQAGTPGTSGTATGGTPAAMGGGGAGGAAGAPSIPAAAIKASCTSLCSSLQGCGTLWTFAPTCQDDCYGDLAVKNGACSDLGLEMSACLAVADRIRRGDSCLDDWMFALSDCYEEIAAYRECAGEAGGALYQSHICLHVGGAFDGGCNETRACLDDKLYQLKCEDTAPDTSSCSCTEHQFVTNFTVDASTTNGCAKHLAQCFAAAK